MDLPAAVNSVVRRRAERMPAELPHWQAAAASLLSRTSASDAALLLATVRDPAALRRLLQLLQRTRDPQQAVAAWMQTVDASEESLADWLAALDVLLSSHNHAIQRADLHRLVGFLECCATVVESGANYPSLPATAQLMLETYGFDASGQQA
jgi:hypothetical protein